jgi:hypothetical protein
MVELNNNDIFELIELLRNCARGHGYLLAVHGSLERDIDLLAVPWSDNCLETDKLVDSLAKLVEEKYGDISLIPCDHNKPHGRKAWAIFFGKEIYIDLSVIPVIE